MRDLILVFLTALVALFYSLAKSDPSVFGGDGLNVLRVALLVLGGLLFIRVGSLLIVDVAARQRGSEPSSLLRLLVSVFLTGIAVMVVVHYGLGLDLGVFLATSALITAIIGLAMQATLGNLFAGIALQLERPFRIGDVVRIDDLTGHVEQMSWRSVTIRRFDRRRVILPNSVPLSGAVTVYPSNASYRSDVDFEIPSDVPPELVLRVGAEVIADIPDTDPNPGRGVIVRGFDVEHGAVRYTAMLYPTSYAAGYDGEMMLFRRLWYALYRNGVRFPRPLGARHRGSIFARESFVSAVDRVADIDGPVRERLARAVRCLPFAAGEQIAVPDPSPKARFVIARGDVRVKLAVGTVPSPDVARQAEPTWDRCFLVRLTESLTEEIGPVSPALVEQAVARTDDPTALFEDLATQIEEDAARERFREVAPRFTFLRIGAGFLFDPETIDADGEIRGGTMRAVAETEILEIREPSLAGRLSEDVDVDGLLADWARESR